MPMRVLSLRRYPVKSMGGEPLASVSLDARGLAGDRWYAVADEDGHFASGKNTRRFRRRDQVFDYAAATDDEGVVTVRGASGAWTVGDPALDAELTGAMGVAVRVAPEAAVPHQDDGSVSLVSTATLEWCAQRWGIDADPRRLRANIVVAADRPFIEEDWVGSTVSIGGAVLRVVERVPRCRMIDLDQDGARATGRWLARLGQERETCLAVYADVAAPGVVSVGDEVSLG